MKNVPRNSSFFENERRYIVPQILRLFTEGISEEWEKVRL